jgi:hypothetical protein
MKMNIIKTALAAATLSVCAGGASASILGYSIVAKSGVPVNASFTGESYGGVGASFGMTDASNALGLGNSFVAFCLDLAGTIKNNQDYEINNVDPFQTERVLSVYQRGNVEKLFDASYGSVDATDSIQAAAFQIALWETGYQNDDGTGMDLTAGNFTGAGRSTNAAAVSVLAKTYLDNMLGVVPNTYNVNFLDATVAARQDLVMATVVPLPAAGLLLVGGMGALGAVRRRAKKVA